jgi:predicted nucleic acid-binding Zn ribbon protein
MMPLFDYQCPCCKTKEEHFVHRYDDPVICKKCDVFMNKLFSGTFNNALQFPAEGLFLKHVSAKGHLFRSKAEMKQFEKDHNMVIEYLH